MTGAQRRKIRHELTSRLSRKTAMSKAERLTILLGAISAISLLGAFLIKGTL